MKTLESFLEKVAQISDEANVARVFGQPHVLEGRTLIPVAEVTYGFGGGFGISGSEDLEETEVDEEAVAQGGGGGAGAKARPLAYIEVRPEGTVIRAIEDEQKIALAGILLTGWIFGWLGLVVYTAFRKR